MGLETGAAIALSTAIGTGASVIQGQQRARSAKRIRTQEKIDRDRIRRADVREAKRAREGDIATRRIVEQKGQDIRNQQLQRRNITPFGSDTSEAILSEST